MPGDGANCRGHDFAGSRDVAAAQLLESAEPAAGNSDGKHNRGQYLVGTTALRYARSQAGLLPAAGEKVAIWPRGSFVGSEQLAAAKRWWELLLLRSGCFRKTTFTRADGRNGHI